MAEHGKNSDAQQPQEQPHLRYTSYRRRVGRRDDPDGRTHIYVMECAAFVKVGLAVDPTRRLSDLQKGCPPPIRLRRSLSVRREVASYAEHLAHLSLSDAHHRDEWFRCDVERAKRVVHAAVYRAQRVPEGWVNWRNDPRKWSSGREKGCARLRLAEEALKAPWLAGPADARQEQAPRTAQN